MIACAENSLEPAKQEIKENRLQFPEQLSPLQAHKKGPKTICVNSLNHKPQLALPLKQLHTAPCKAEARYFSTQITFSGGPPILLGLVPFLIEDFQTFCLGSTRKWGMFASTFVTLLFHCCPVLLTRVQFTHPDWFL